jgi:hypothetical protein
MHLPQQHPVTFTPTGDIEADFRYAAEGYESDLAHLLPSEPSAAVRRRLAEVRMELGMCEIKEGRRGRGAATIARSVLESPSQMREIKRIGGRKLRKMAGDPRKA